MNKHRRKLMSEALQLVAPFFDPTASIRYPKFNQESPVLSVLLADLIHVGRHIEDLIKRKGTSDRTKAKLRRAYSTCIQIAFERLGIPVPFGSFKSSIDGPGSGPRPSERGYVAVMKKLRNPAMGIHSIAQELLRDDEKKDYPSDKKKIEKEMAPWRWMLDQPHQSEFAKNISKSDKRKK